MISRSKVSSAQSLCESSIKRSSIGVEYLALVRIGRDLPAHEIAGGGGAAVIAGASRIET